MARNHKNSNKQTSKQKGFIKNALIKEKEGDFVTHICIHDKQRFWKRKVARDHVMKVHYGFMR